MLMNGRNHHNIVKQSSSVQFSHSVVSDSLRPHELQHARSPCPSPTPGVYSNSCPLSPTISSSVVLFSSWIQSFPASGSFPVSQFFPSGGQIIGVSALESVLPINIQDWFPLGWTGWIFLKSKELSRVMLCIKQLPPIKKNEKEEKIMVWFLEYYRIHVKMFLIELCRNFFHIIKNDEGLVVTLFSVR